MRTDKIYSEKVSLSEWRSEVENHYKPENQLKRVDETVAFIRNYCEEYKQNKVSTFSNVWGYLDVDAEYLEVFKKSLKESMSSFSKLKISYNRKKKDIIVSWE